MNIMNQIPKRCEFAPPYANPSPRVRVADLTQLFTWACARCDALIKGEAMCQFFIWTNILALVKEKIYTRKNAARKKEDDLLLRENEVQKTKDKLVQRERVFFQSKRRKLESNS